MQPIDMFYPDTPEYVIDNRFQILKMSKLAYDQGYLVSTQFFDEDSYPYEVFYECIDTFVDFYKIHQTDCANEYWTIKDRRLTNFYKNLEVYEKLFGQKAASSFLADLEEDIKPHLNINTYVYDWGLYKSESKKYPDRIKFAFGEGFDFYVCVIEGLLKLLNWYKNSSDIMRKQIYSYLKNKCGENNEKSGYEQTYKIAV